MTYNIYKKILAETDRKCYYCGCHLAGENYAEMEHVIPRSRGGADRAANRVASCKKCNRAKGTMFIHEWREKIIADTGNPDFKFHFKIIGLPRKGEHKYMDLMLERPDLMKKYGLI